jgi:hypothetical protein
MVGKRIAFVYWTLAILGLFAYLGTGIEGTLGVSHHVYGLTGWLELDHHRDGTWSILCIHVGSLLGEYAVAVFLTGLLWTWLRLIRELS